MLRGPSRTNWAFEEFKVMTEMRLLIAGGSPVPLTSKAFDTLVVLIENRDRVVTKDQLLRKALGETAQQPRYIITIPGHGYRFTARVNAISDDTAATALSTNGAASPPAALSRGAIFIRTSLALFGVIALLVIVLGSRSMPIKEADVPLDFTRHITRITESGKATLSAISPDGRYIAYVENDGDQYSLWVKQVGTDGKAAVVPRQPLPLAHLSFSPDGEYLYFARRSARGPMFNLSRIPIIGGLETPVLDDVDSPVSFSPDGREFVFQRGASPESHIVVATVGGGPQSILAMRKSPLTFSVFAPDWSPDGKVVAASVIDASTGSKAIVLLPVDGTSSRELYTSDSLLGRLRWLPDGSGLLTVISEGLEGRLLGRLSGGTIWRIGYQAVRPNA